MVYMVLLMVYIMVYMVYTWYKSWYIWDRLWYYVVCVYMAYGHVYPTVGLVLRQ